MRTAIIPAPPVTTQALRFVAAFTDAVIERHFLNELVAMRRERRAAVAAVEATREATRAA